MVQRIRFTGRIVGISFLVAICMYAGILPAQVNPKPVKQSAPDINKMIDDEMKKAGTPDLVILEGGAKGQMFVKFDGDFSPVYIGVKGEAGIEAKAGPFTVEEKDTMTVGVTVG